MELELIAPKNAFAELDDEAGQVTPASTAEGGRATSMGLTAEGGCATSADAGCAISDDVDERTLVERARTDRHAFAALYRRHYSAIARYIFRRVGDTHVAEDLAADVFLAAMKGLPRFRYRDIPISAWLYRIATNAVHRWAKRRRRQAIRDWDRACDVPCGRAADFAAAQNGTDLTGNMARAALLTLPPKHQDVLALHYLEGLSISEIAASLGCREGTVKSRLARGREALRERLEERRTLS